MHEERRGIGWLVPILLLVLVTAGCWKRNVYEGLRLHQGMDCQKLHGTDQDECNRRSGMSYDEYERQRNQETPNR